MTRIWNNSYICMPSAPATAHGSPHTNYSKRTAPLGIEALAALLGAQHVAPAGLADAAARGAAAGTTSERSGPSVTMDGSYTGGGSAPLQTRV